VNRNEFSEFSFAADSYSDDFSSYSSVIYFQSGKDLFSVFLKSSKTLKILT